ncbi:MAG: DEAD/DEAH box helicase [Planctomycetes bacterium]|nr:DEAD/DEAH box helicase [Planctomycetota bacterium]MBI3834805.1 DEAD/DEAH box helicase [Planctomycetota bacterium]
MQFEDLRLSEPLLRAVREAGYRTPTPIQIATIPHVLDGKDLLGCAQTGTGKTAAFALPMLQRLSAKRGPIRPGVVRSLVLCPTRELAQQIVESFHTYGVHSGLGFAAIFGGVNQNPQVRSIRGGLDVLVATPGRLLDLMDQRLVSLAAIETLVLDEADRMFDMGFLPALRRILAVLPKVRQTLLFSATMPAPIRELANKVLKSPVSVQIERLSSPTPTVDHWVHHVEKPAKNDLLIELLAKSPRSRALIFTRTKHGADKVTRHLIGAGVNAGALHGNKSQGARTRALAEFKSAGTGVLVATDIAARGLDVHDISHVINYDLTNDPETYVHRIGRAGRAGAKGTAISFCTSEERGDLKSIERLLQQPLQQAGQSPAREHSSSSAGTAVATRPIATKRPWRNRNRRERL